MMTNQPNGTLYTGVTNTGVTNDLIRRAFEHREGIVSGFTKRYRLTRLVYFERHETITAAIQREHNMKHWPRRWKVRLVLDANPEWRDLYDQVTGFVDCMEMAPNMGDAGGHSDRGLVLSTVAISDPPASRSNARTVDWALARIQSGVPTNRGMDHFGE